MSDYAQRANPTYGPTQLASIESHTAQCPATIAPYGLCDRARMDLTNYRSDKLSRREKTIQRQIESLGLFQIR
jgi:hypothetical protein